MKKLALLAAVLGLSCSFNTYAKEDQSSVIERIKPFGSVCVQGKECAVKVPVVAAAPAAVRVSRFIPQCARVVMVQA